MRSRISAVVVAGVLAMSARSWAALIINFDPPPAGDLPASLSAMGNSPGSAVPIGSQLSNQYNTGSSTDGVLFSSTVPYVAVVGATDPNGIGGVTSGGLLSYADPVIFTFVVPATTLPGVTSNFSIQADATGIPGQYATATAFDIDGNVLDAITLNDVGSEVWSFDLPGIHSVRFNFPTTSGGALTTGTPFGGGTGIALDNLTFGAVTESAGPPNPPTPSAVPLPPMGWEALLVIGSLSAIHVLRRRARKGSLADPF